MVDDEVLNFIWNFTFIDTNSNINKKLSKKKFFWSEPKLCEHQTNFKKYECNPVWIHFV